MSTIVWKASLDGNIVDQGTVALPDWLAAVSAFVTKLGITPDVQATGSTNGTAIAIGATISGHAITGLTVPESSALQEVDETITAITGTHPTFAMDVSITP